jgi:hypothetical protein
MGQDFYGWISWRVEIGRIRCEIFVGAFLIAQVPSFWYEKVELSPAIDFSKQQQQQQHQQLTEPSSFSPKRVFSGWTFANDQSGGKHMCH